MIVNLKKNNFARQIVQKAYEESYYSVEDRLKVGNLKKTD